MADKSVGQIAGTIVGGIIGAFIPGGYVALGASIGGMVGGMIDPPKGPNVVGPRLSDLSAQTAAYGTVIPRVHGSGAIYGNVFWIENGALKETERTESQGGKGGGGGSSVTTYSYSATFAVGLCEGPITNIRRIWAGSKLIYSKDSTDLGTIFASNEVDALNFDIYYGTADQLPDDRMQATLGVANTPAWRGLCYIVFKDFQLADYGNSLLGCPMKVEVVNQPVTWGEMTLGNAPNVNGWTLSGTYFDGTTVKTLYRQGEDRVFFVEETDRYGRYLGGYQFSYDASIAATLNAGPSGQTDIPCFSLMLISGENRIYWMDYNGTQLYTHTFPHAFNGRMPIGIKKVGDDQFIHYLATGTAFYVWGPEPTDYFSVTAPLNGIHDVAFSDTHFYLAEQQVLSLPARVTIVEIATGTIVETLTDIDGYQTSGIPMIHCDDAGVAWLLTFQTTDTVPGNVYKVADGEITLHAPDVFIKQGTYGSYGDFWSDGHLFYSINRRDTTPTSLINALALDLAYPKVEAGGVTLQSIVEAECTRSGLLSLTDIDASELTDIVRFYRIAAVGAIRGSLDPLQAAWPFDVVPDGYGITFPRRGKASLLTVPYDDLGATAPGERDVIRVTESREMDSQLPQRVTVSYLDVNREYDTGEQFAERLNTDAVNVRMLEMAIGFNADEAAGKAEVLLYLAWLERYDLTFVLPPKADYLKLQPADVITLTGDGYTREVRLTSINLLPDGRLECAAKFNFAATYTPAAQGEEGQGTGSGTVSYASPTDAEYLDIPCLDSTIMDQPGFIATAGGAISSWPGAVLYRSNDTGQTWTSVQGLPTPGSIIGVTTAALADGRSDLIDTANTLKLRKMTYGTLASVTDAVLANGGNHFAVGVHGRWEIIAAKTVVAEADGTFTLYNLMRGRFGTEQYAALHATGDTVALLDPSTVRFIGMSTADFGLARDWKAATIGGIFDTEPETSFTYAGVNLKPLSPIRLNGHRDLGTLDWTLLWTRRSRTPVEPFSGLPTPIGESSETYEVEIWNASYTTLKRTISGLSAATCPYSSAQQIADFGDNQSTLYVRVYQLSSVVGRGYPLQASITRNVNTGTFWDSVVLACHFNGSNGSTTFTDLKSHPLTAVGNAQLSTASPTYGTASLLCDGSGDYVSTPFHADFEFRAGALLIEAVVYMTAATEHVLFSRMSASSGINYEHRFSVFQDHAHVYWGRRGSNQTHIKLIWPSTLPLNTLVHVAIQRDAAGYWTAYLDGAPCTTYQFSPTSSGISYGAVTSLPYQNAVDFGAHTIAPSIGGDLLGSNTGRLDEIIVARSAPYTGAFTPTLPFPYN